MLFLVQLFEFCRIAVFDDAEMIIALLGRATQYNYVIAQLVSGLLIRRQMIDFKSREGRGQVRYVGHGLRH